MSKLPYLNLGCGSHFNKQWTNIDFAKVGDDVIACDLLKGIPFADDTFEVVYHSHVLEHFSKDKAINFITECYRVLKSGGIIRIAIPDLEQIVQNYSRLLAAGKTAPENERIRADYEWMVIEMYDQTVRNQGGGEMLKYLSAKTLINEDFIIDRIGHEGKMLRKSILHSFTHTPQKRPVVRKILSSVKSALSPRNYKDHLLKILFPKDYKLLQLARFKQCGEIHQWMYDIYSISYLLKKVGFTTIAQKGFDESNIPDWRSFELDEVENAIRKPDSLFVEAIK